MSQTSLWLVDDDPELGVVVSILCKRNGLRLTRFMELAPVWQALQAEQPLPELLLLDVNLPGESGLELLRRLPPTSPRRPPIALFCQTGLARDAARAWELGADYLLAKELVVDPARWAGRVTEILQHSRGMLPLPKLEWIQEKTKATPVSWAKLLTQQISHPELRVLGGFLLAQVLRRCLIAGFGPGVGDCLHPISGRLSAVALARPATPAQVHQILATFLDQLTRLLARVVAETFEHRLRSAWIDS